MFLRSQSEELSPFQIKILAISGQIEEKEKNIKRLQQLWMKQQGTLVGLNQEKGTNSKHTLKLQTEYTSMVQKKMRFEGRSHDAHAVAHAPTIRTGHSRVGGRFPDSLKFTHRILKHALGE